MSSKEAQLKALCEKAELYSSDVYYKAGHGWSVPTELGYQKLGRSYEQAVEYLLAKIENQQVSKDFKLEEVDYSDDQKEGLRLLIAAATGRKAVAVLKGYAGSGKSLADHSPVKTPKGDVPIGDIKEGDLVITRDGSSTPVTGVFPQGVLPTYRITFRDGASVECSADHIWSVWTHKMRQRGSSPKNMTLQEIMDKGLRFSGKNGPFRFYIPLCDAVEYPKKEYIIQPYTLGALLGDGSLTGNTCTLVTPDKEIISNISNELPDGVTIYQDIDRKNGACDRYNLVCRDTRGSVMMEECRRLGIDVLSVDKHIPASYLLGSVNQRIELLRGLMDTDGSISDNRVSFSSKSKKLAEGVAELARSIGGTAIVSAYDRTSDNKGIEFRVNVKLFINPFRLSRKSKNWSFSKKNPPSRAIVDISRVDDTEHTCIKVEDSSELFLTKDFIVTHNTTLLQHLPHELKKVSKKRLKLVYCAPTHQAVKVLSSKIPLQSCTTIHSLLRLKLTKEKGRTYLKQLRDPQLDDFDCIIVDECSMINEEVFNILMSSVSRTFGTSVVFVGDPKQLNPINEEESLTFGSGPEIEMTKILRQAEGNPILDNSKRLRRMRRFDISKLRFFANDQGDGVHKVRTTDWKYLIRDMFNTEEFRNNNDFVRCLAWTNEAVDTVNKDVHTLLYGKTEFPYSVGEKIMTQEMILEGLVKTNEELTVTGIVEEISMEFPCYRINATTHLGLEVEFLTLKEECRYEFAKKINKLADVKKWDDFYLLSENFVRIQHCYAMTVHRSQGSTFDNVLINAGDILRSDDQDSLISLLYVAITRARVNAHLKF